MDYWMIDRAELPGDLPDVFSALNGILERYNWVVSGTDLWFGPNATEEVRRRWGWTGLLMEGRELLGYLQDGSVRILSGVLSAVPRRTRAEAVRDYAPSWEDKGLFSPEYRFQTPLTQMEIICYDGWAIVIVCEEAMSRTVRTALPMAKRTVDFDEKRR